MPFPARKCGDFLFVDGIISVLIPVSIQALVPILMPVLMLTSRPRKFSATIFLGSIAGPDYACLVRVFFARWFLPGGALRIKSHPFSPILRAPENRSGRSYAEQPLFYGGKMYVFNIYCCCRIHHPERCGAGLRQKIDADLFNKPMELHGEIRILVAVNQRLNVRFSHNIYM